MGFIVNNKPVKSPGTPGSTNSNSLYTGAKYGTKKFGSVASSHQPIMGGGLNHSTDFGIYERRNSKIGISGLKSNSRNQHHSISESKPNLSIKPPPPAPMPSSSILNSSGIGGLSSTALTGGGLTRGGGMVMGRHQM